MIMGWIVGQACSVDGLSFDCLLVAMMLHAICYKLVFRVFIIWKIKEGSNLTRKCVLFVIVIIFI
jgi:hypothetical protein